MTLQDQIGKSSLQLSTDSYEMSIGELMNIYRDGELIVNPEFQRLFRWNTYQKSHLIESLLIGVPIPSIFVFERQDGNWELVDGLQRVSTILEFAGLLKDTNGNKFKSSVLSETRYLPSLEGVSWDGSPKDSKSIGTTNQIAIKRARITLQILKKTSDEKAKFDLFQRLNSHGSVATPQELRNCVLYMIDETRFRKMKDLSEKPEFLSIIQLTKTAKNNQAAMDFLTRFLVFTYIEYDRSWDIEEYLDNGIIEIAAADKAGFRDMLETFERAVALLVATGKPDILRRYRAGRFQGRVGQAAFETIFLGVAQNVSSIEKRANPKKYVIDRVKKMWTESDVHDFTKAGLRGTDRIQKTVGFGKRWFSK